MSGLLMTHVAMWACGEGFVCNSQVRERWRAGFKRERGGERALQSEGQRPIKHGEAASVQEGRLHARFQRTTRLLGPRLRDQ